MVNPTAQRGNVGLMEEAWVDKGLWWWAASQQCFSKKWPEMVLRIQTKMSRLRVCD